VEQVGVSGSRELLGRAKLAVVECPTVRTMEVRCPQPQVQATVGGMASTLSFYDGGLDLRLRLGLHFTSPSRKKAARGPSFSEQLRSMYHDVLKPAKVFQNSSVECTTTS
jgi:hypothetical protein